MACLPEGGAIRHDIRQHRLECGARTRVVQPHETDRRGSNAFGQLNPELPGSCDQRSRRQRLRHRHGRDQVRRSYCRHPGRGSECGKPRPCRRCRQRMTGADVDTLERFVEQQQPARFRLPAGNHRLLLVAAGQRPDRRERPRGLDAKTGDRLLGLAALAAADEETVRIPLGKMRQADGCR